jgi:hypothetical protein
MYHWGANMSCFQWIGRFDKPRRQGFRTSVVTPLGKILGREVTIATFTNHLSEFSQEKRGSVLERDGQPWGYRFRFRNPLIVPFSFMNAVDSGLLIGEDLIKMLREG